MFGDVGAMWYNSINVNMYSRLNALFDIGRNFLFCTQISIAMDAEWYGVTYNHSPSTALPGWFPQRARSQCWRAAGALQFRLCHLQSPPKVGVSLSLAEGDHQNIGVVSLEVIAKSHFSRWELTLADHLLLLGVWKRTPTCKKANTMEWEADLM